MNFALGLTWIGSKVVEGQLLVLGLPGKVLDLGGYRGGFREMLPEASPVSDGADAMAPERTCLWPRLSPSAAAAVPRGSVFREREKRCATAARGRGARTALSQNKCTCCLLAHLSLLTVRSQVLLRTSKKSPFFTVVPS